MSTFEISLAGVVIVIALICYKLHQHKKHLREKRLSIAKQEILRNLSEQFKKREPFYSDVFWNDYLEREVPGLQFFEFISILQKMERKGLLILNPVGNSKTNEYVLGNRLSAYKVALA